MNFEKRGFEMLELIETKKDLENVLKEFSKTFEKIVLENIQDDFENLPKEIFVTRILNLPDDVKNKIFNKIFGTKNLVD
ncbi:MAG: hypothetical protein DRP02_13595 [Candidatus Gerdarchaeota archaeon]|nr:MAG: hypothetical protein DRP02_13595 [Candidatus Gerdarchaeota archaeon]